MDALTETPPPTAMHRLDTLAEAMRAHAGHPGEGQLRAMLVAQLEDVFDGSDRFVMFVLREMEHTGRAPSQLIQQIVDRNIL